MNQWEKTRRRAGDTRFPSTHWSAILKARTQDENRRRLATESLIAAYWKPVYCYLRRRGYGNEEAEDLTQDFFCAFFLRAKLLQAADRKIGRFRQLLLTALKRFAQNTERDRKRQKRAPAGGILSFSSAPVERVDLPEAAAAPDEAFYYAWITDLLDQVLTEIKEQYCSSGMTRHWDIFHLKVLAPILEDVENLSMRSICQRCGVATEGQAANMLITVKRRFVSVLRRRLRDLVRSDAEAEAEFQEILRFLSGGGAAGRGPSGKEEYEREDG
jgi:DNA-directed RNA polymerase specialized sigma24 family protein